MNLKIELDRIMETIVYRVFKDSQLTYQSIIQTYQNWLEEKQNEVPTIGHDLSSFRVSCPNVEATCKYILKEQQDKLYAIVDSLDDSINIMQQYKETVLNQASQMDKLLKKKEKVKK